MHHSDAVPDQVMAHQQSCSRNVSIGAIDVTVSTEGPKRRTSLPARTMATGPLRVAAIAGPLRMAQAHTTIAAAAQTAGPFRCSGSLHLRHFPCRQELRTLALRRFIVIRS
jgi:hypothetical protein